VETVEESGENKNRLDLKLTRQHEDRGHYERRCGVQRLPLLWMSGDILRLEALYVGLDVAGQCVLIVEDSKIDLPLDLDEYDDFAEKIASVSLSFEI
jgi:hypothetical protein